MNRLTKPDIKPKAVLRKIRTLADGRLHYEIVMPGGHVVTGSTLESKSVLMDSFQKVADRVKNKVGSDELRIRRTSHKK